MRATWPALLIALATVAHAQVPSPKSVEAAVLAALAERDRVFAAGDENAVARFMADDYPEMVGFEPSLRIETA